MTTNLRAHFDGKVLIPVGSVDLPAGQELELRVTPVSEAKSGSGDAILRAVSQPPHLSKADVDELERLMDEGKTGANSAGVFDDLR